VTDFFKEIYENKAEQYEAMVAREDYELNIPRALQEIRPFVDLEVVELGAGTGRLTAIIAPLARRIRAFDESAQMLAVAAGKLEAAGLDNWETAVADNGSLPVGDGEADLAIAGWSLGHATGWYPDTWKEEIGRALAEMHRVLSPGGTIIILETMGTGRETPEPPVEGLARFYAWLEGELGFSYRWIRTDYRFDNPEQAADLTRFFFGGDLADRLLAERRAILPECTGIWWRHQPTTT
jgi:ubiquinone/menaquinone biosynthesis C-methylase UbiE